MGVQERAYERDVQQLSKSIKRPLAIVADIMSIGFTDKEYLTMFKQCFRGAWERIVEFKREHDILDAQRKRKHKTKLLYNFPSPIAFVLNQSKAIRTKKRNDHLSGMVLPEKEREYLRHHYINKTVKRQAEKNQAANNVERYKQRVNPGHTNYFIETYFDVKHKHPEDVNTRMRILEEAAKFQCAETEAFMRKVNSAETNYHLRHFAFTTLQKTFGHQEVHLHANRRGKKHPGDDIEPNKMDTPELLMAEIYNSEYNLEENKTFDVFLSHSSKDITAILKIKTTLNRQGLSVYVDWIEDRQTLKRDLTSVDTAKAIIERIKQSSSILYVLTNSSLNSRWTPWELGYAYAKRKKICVLQMEDMEDVPEYLQITDKAIIDGDEIFIKGIDKQTINSWIIS